MSDGPCHRCGAYGGYGCYECIPPEDIDRRISAEISRLNTTITELRKEAEEALRRVRHPRPMRQHEEEADALLARLAAEREAQP